MHSAPKVKHFSKTLVAVLSVSLAGLLTAATAGSRFGLTDRFRIRQLEFFGAVTSKRSPSASSPSVVLWAWERPENLRFLEGEDAGVAFLAKTIILGPSKRLHNETGGSLLVRPRLQPLRVSPATPLIAVVRIETSVSLKLSTYSTPRDSASAVSSYSAFERESIASEIAELQNFPGVRAIQIDYDATVSERQFYASILSDIRRKLPAAIPLSVTALASWCIGDPWLEHLPRGTIQEAVPMLFRMGPDAGNVAKFLRSGEDFPVASCRGSLGLSTDESLSRELLNRRLPGTSFRAHQKRIYVFSPRAWTASAAESILKEWQP